MSRALFALPLLCGICWAAPPEVDPESIEPPLGYSLQIGDKAVRLREGESTKLDGTFTNPEVKLTTDEFRTFPYAGLSFRYPKGFAFEADLVDGDLRIWSLDGNNCVITVQSHAEKVTVAAFAASLVEQYGRKNCHVTDVMLTLAGQKLTGKRIEAKIATATIVQEVFLVKSDARVILLVLQDTPNDDGTESDERKRVGKLLTASFVVNPKR